MTQQSEPEETASSSGYEVLLSMQDHTTATMVYAAICRHNTAILQVSWTTNRENVTLIGLV